MELLSRTEPVEWQTVAELYPAMRRFAGRAAPFDLEPDDLLQEALAVVVRKRRLTELDHPAAYVRKTILSVAAPRSLNLPRPA